MGGTPLMTGIKSDFEADQVRARERHDAQQGVRDDVSTSRASVCIE